MPRGNGRKACDKRTQCDKRWGRTTMGVQTMGVQSKVIPALCLLGQNALPNNSQINKPLSDHKSSEGEGGNSKTCGYPGPQL